MKGILAAFTIFIAFTSTAQKLTTKNFHKQLAGVWEFDSFCDENWQPTEWMCIDRHTINDTGLVESVRTCEGMDEPIVSISKWTRFDEEEKVIYTQYYDSYFGTGWAEEFKHYWVISYTKTELRVEVRPRPDAIKGGDELTTTLRIIFKRIE